MANQWFQLIFEVSRSTDIHTKEEKYIEILSGGALGKMIRLPNALKLQG